MQSWPLVRFTLNGPQCNIITSVTENVSPVSGLFPDEWNYDYQCASKDWSHHVVAENLLCFYGIL